MRAIALLLLASCGRLAFDPIDDGGDVTSSEIMLALGGAHTCARVASDVACWGVNSEAQLGRGTVTPDGPIEYVPGLGAIVYISSGVRSMFAIDSAGRIWSWGDSIGLMLGVAEPSNPRVAPAVSPVLADIVEIAGTRGMCARASDGMVTCWGDGDAGQLAIGSLPDNTLPVPSLLPSTERLEMGVDHACGFAQGQLSCWGVNELGQLGLDPAQTADTCKTTDNTMVPCSIAPVAVPGVIDPIAFSAGRSHTCAIFSDARVRCWGGNSDGQLGNGTMTASATPVDSGLGGALDVVAARHHSCALLADGTAWCWGDNGLGALGNGTTADSPVPVRVEVPTQLRMIASHSEAGHTCAIDAEGAIWCWGNNASGQLGATGLAPGVPHRVVLP